MEELKDFSEFEAFVARFTNYERVVNLSYDKKTLGPRRMEALCAALGNPEAAVPTLHIAGTKGKGSTCLMLEALLSAGGFRVGTYTSPHVEHLRERIRIHRAPIAEEQLVARLNEALPYLTHCQDHVPEDFPTFFEIMTALALTCLRADEVDWGIFEVGLGGRLDATNVVLPAWTAITSIGLEHTQQLGDRLESIAREKAGIIKKGIPLVLGEVPPEAEREILAVAETHEARVVQPGRSMVTSAGPRKIQIDTPTVHRAFPAGAVRGPALRSDLALALAIFEGVLSDAGRTLSTTELERGIEQIELPARLEWIDSDPPILLDGAHTTESIRALRHALDEIEFPRPRTLVFSLASDKRVDSILTELRAMDFAEIIWTRPDALRSIPPRELAAQFGRGEVNEEPTEALEQARRIGNPIVITGSFYLAGALRKHVVRS